MKKLKASGVKVIFVYISPSISREKTFNYKDMKYKTIYEFKKEYPFLNALVFNPMNDYYYSDNAHLNEKGKKKLSNWIALQIEKEF
ncbi:SGNH/GDSL hydrolase family protein [Allofrancisella guangzhouensis]|uniref:SGNH/GDSL hydrolase family protein n=1 Tax=Allofrancisella guangzhouensis TaxID=594679 RepID=UPI001907439A|nr:SGNH/GDSL hydrolase family protein [Allofrancisella guangzhouensis]MBK2045037.1 SGNH/GDSL hydrolase family protein [Allofrancisella guangzhouensis]